MKIKISTFLHLYIPFTCISAKCTNTPQQSNLSFEEKKALFIY